MKALKWAASAALVTLMVIGNGASAFTRPGDAAAHPAESTVTRSVAVDMSGLDLGSMRDRAEVESRIVDAARRACGYNGTHGAKLPQDYRRCFSQARIAALDELAQRPALSPRS